MNDDNKPTLEQVNNMERAEVLDAAAMGESNPNRRIGMIAAAFAAVRGEERERVFSDKIAELQDLLSPSPCSKGHRKIFWVEWVRREPYCTACKAEQLLTYHDGFTAGEELAEERVKPLVEAIKDAEKKRIFKNAL